jgi:hypothetical protein
MCMCIHSLEMIRDPVVSTSGYTYEKEAILKHLGIVLFLFLSREPNANRRMVVVSLSSLSCFSLEGSKTDPITRQPCTPEDLRPNYAMSLRIEEYLKSRSSSK